MMTGQLLGVVGLALANVLGFGLEDANTGLEHGGLRHVLDQFLERQRDALHTRLHTAEPDVDMIPETVQFGFEI